LPAEIDAVAGEIAIETSVTAAGSTVRVAPLDVTPLCEAVIIVEPAATPVATPKELIVAVAALEEFQVTVEVRF
jgi:hypothetical protein